MSITDLRNFPRDRYDLSYQRSKQQFRHSGFAGEDDCLLEYFRSRDKKLDDLSKLIRKAIEKRDALVFCQNFLTCVLESRPHPLTNINSSPWGDALPPSRPDAATEEEQLRARLELVAGDQLLQDMQIQTLKHLGDTVRQRRREDASRYEGPHLLYRVHRPGSHTFYHEDVGFCCPRWLRERNFDKPSEEDFRCHVNGDVVSSKGAFETPYISMTGSPSRALNLVPYDQMSSTDVFLIDSERLWAMTIHFQRTTTIADRYSSRIADYITNTHWVAQYWIPADCIIMRMPFNQFQAVCARKGIHRGRLGGPFDEDCLGVIDFIKARIEENEEESQRLQRSMMSLQAMVTAIAALLSIKIE